MVVKKRFHHYEKLPNWALFGSSFDPLGPGWLETSSVLNEHILQATFLKKVAQEYVKKNHMNFTLDHDLCQMIIYNQVRSKLQTLNE